MVRCLHQLVFLTDYADEEEARKAVRPFTDSHLGKAVIGAAAVGGGGGAIFAGIGALKSAYRPKTGESANQTLALNATQPGQHNVSVVGQGQKP